MFQQKLRVERLIKKQNSQGVMYCNITSLIFHIRYSYQNYIPVIMFFVFSRHFIKKLLIKISRNTFRQLCKQKLVFLSSKSVAIPILFKLEGGVELNFRNFVKTCILSVSQLAKLFQNSQALVATLICVYIFATNFFLFY